MSSKLHEVKLLFLRLYEPVFPMISLVGLVGLCESLVL